MDTELSTDLGQPTAVLHTRLPWVPSPSTPGMRLRILAHHAGQPGQLTAVAECEPGTRFGAHDHVGGEEIMVLRGVLTDDSGSYGSGTYIKNPPGSAHSAFTLTGCLLFIKLGHLDPQDHERVVVDSHKAAWQPSAPGLSVLRLWQFGATKTGLLRWAPGAYFEPHRHYGGEEIFILEGELEDEHGRHPQGSWLRGPHLSSHSPFSVPGCTMLVKTGHLPVG